MRASTLARGGLRRAKPLALAVGLSARNADREVDVSVVDLGDPALTRALADATGATVRAPTPADLVVCALAPGGDLTPHRQRLAEHRRRGGDVLVAVLGSAAQRRRGIRQLQAEPDLGIACAVTLAALDERGAREFREAVITRLGLAAVPAARRTPGLRDTATHLMVHRAARRAALVAALPSQAATMPILTVIQARLASDVSALGGGRTGPREAAQVGGIAVGAPVWRQGARLLSSAAHGAAVAVRSGIAYGVTRGVGALSARLRSDDSTPPEEDS